MKEALGIAASIIFTYFLIRVLFWLTPKCWKCFKILYIHLFEKYLPYTVLIKYFGNTVLITIVSVVGICSLAIVGINFLFAAKILTTAFPIAGILTAILSVAICYFFLFISIQEDFAPKSHTVYNGSGTPKNSIGVAVAYYIDNDTGDLYEKYRDDYSLISNCETIRKGAGVPSNELGKDNDFYINTDNNDLYVKNCDTYSIRAREKKSPIKTIILKSILAPVAALLLWLFFCFVLIFYFGIISSWLPS